MKAHHLVVVVLVILAVYLIGVKYPALGQAALAKVGL